MKYDSGPNIELVDVTLTTEILRNIGNKDFVFPKIENTPCLQKMAKLGLTAEACHELLQEAREEIQEIKKLLAGVGKSFYFCYRMAATLFSEKSCK